MLVLLLLLISRLINRSGLRVSNFKVFSSGLIKLALIEERDQGQFGVSISLQTLNILLLSFIRVKTVINVGIFHFRSASKKKRLTRLTAIHINFMNWVKGKSMYCIVIFVVIP